MAVELVRKLWTTEEYELMIEKGVLTEDDRVELIRGEIVEMAPMGVRHRACVARLDEILHELLGRRVTIFVQSPIRLPNSSEPEPDIAVLKRSDDAYAAERASTSDIILLVEVADSTLTTDRVAKVPLYADAGLPQVWIVNLQEDVIEVYSQPRSNTYVSVRRVGRGEVVQLPGGLNGSVSVDEVLG
jgi:Uma2 family endonuclease